MKLFSTSFGIFDKYAENQNYIAEAKDISNQRALEKIGKFIIDNLTDLSDYNRIVITSNEWVEGIPYPTSPNVIPFSKTFVLETE